MTTPRLVLDERRLDQNIARMAERASMLGLRLRPHVKTHKCQQIMQRQLDRGAHGISVATIREAEMFVDAGATDVLIAYPPSGDWRLDRIRALRQRARVIVACDRPEHVTGLARISSATAPLEYYWEVDCGTGRLGTPAGAATVAMLEPLTGLTGVRLAGLMTFPGHAYGVRSDPELAEVATAEGEALSMTAAALRARGIEPGVLSGGSTPAMRVDAGKAAMHEYRPGNYVFYDATQVALGSAVIDDCALLVEATVVSRPAPERVILDCGSKALPAERMSSLTPGFGVIVGHPELTIHALYEEHAVCHSETGSSDLETGDVVSVIPNHACTCANLHTEYLVRGAGGSVQHWSIGPRSW